MRLCDKYKMCLVISEQFTDVDISLSIILCYFNGEVKIDELPDAERFTVEILESKNKDLVREFKLMLMGVE